MPYSPTTWVNGSTPPLSAANLNHIELGLKAAYPVYNVLDSAYGAVGNGAADDTTALQAAITAAAGGGIVYSPPGYTYLCSSTLNVTSACRFDFSGSTIKKAPAMTQYVLYITGSGVTMVNLVQDGNRSGGATGTGVYWLGTNGLVVRCTASHNFNSGWQFDTTSGVVRVYDSVASDNSGSTASDGFRVSTGQVLLFGGNEADNNDRAGYQIDSGASDGCRLEGRAFQNNYSGATIHSNKGYCPYFIAEQTSQFGLTMGAVGGNGWTFDYVETNNTGVAIPGYAQNAAGTGIEVYGIDHCNFGTVISKANLGYGLALATDGTNGCTYNTFHTVTSDQSGAVDGDPGIVVSGSSSNNTFGTCIVRNHSAGVVIGEGTTSNDSNVFGTLFVANCQAGALSIDGGQRNSFQNVVSRNNFTVDLTLVPKAIVTFSTVLSKLNVVGFLDHDDTGTNHATVPAYLVYCDATAANNSVLDGFARASRVGTIDLNGGNYVYLRRPVRRTSLSTFDSGETWSSSTANTVNSQFVEGNGAKKVTGGTDAYTNSQRSGLSLNLSSMADSDWFRMFAYITNKADFNGATPAINLTFQTSAGNTFTVGWDDLMLNNGAQWLYARKGAFTSAGAPSWASITLIQVGVWGHTATSTVTFDDLIIADTKWDRTSTIGQNNTPAVITVGASPFLYQNTDGVPLNVMVSGGTVSAIDYSQDANAFYSQGQVAGIFIVNPGDYTQVTYSVAPSMTKVPTR